MGPIVHAALLIAMACAQGLILIINAAHVQAARLVRLIRPVQPVRPVQQVRRSVRRASLRAHLVEQAHLARQIRQSARRTSLQVHPVEQVRPVRQILPAQPLLSAVPVALVVDCCIKEILLISSFDSVKPESSY